MLIVNSLLIFLSSLIEIRDRHKSISQIREERIREARIRNGLAKEVSDIRAKSPSVTYIDNPLIKGQRGSFRKRKQENVLIELNVLVTQISKI